MGFNLKGTSKHNIVFVLGLVVTLFLLVLFVYAETKDYISVNVINTSSGGTAATSGFTIFSTSNAFTNGTSLSVGFVGGNGSGLSVINISRNRIINLNLSLIANGTHGNYYNVTFGWVLKNNASVMLNSTIINNTLNQTIWNYSFNSNLLPDGIYNISIFVDNATALPGVLIDGVVNYSRGFDLAIDGAAPNVIAFGMNFTNGSNFSSTTFPAAVKLLFTAVANDSTTYVQVIKFGLNNGNGTETNITASRNASLLEAETTNALTEGVFTVTPYFSDSVNNTNVSIANVTFRIDRTPPNVTNLIMNMTAELNFTTDRKIEFNATVNDSTTYVKMVFFNVDNGNGTGFNITGVRGAGTNTTTYVAELITDAHREGYYTVRVFSNDTVGNQNNSEVLRFGIDRNAPNVSNIVHNGTVLNASNFTNGGILSFNVTVNDSALSVKAVSIGLTNDFRNNTQFNVTLLKNYSFWHAEVGLSTLSDGLYTVQVFANDTVDRMNMSVANISFRVDRTPPNVSSASLVMGNISGYGTEGGSPVGYNFSAALAEGNMTLQITVNDSTTHVTFVRFNVSNSSGGIDQLHGPFNYSANRSGNNFTNAPNIVGSEGNLFNLSQLAEGRYNLTVVANDTLSNRNRTVYMAFMIDRTKPAVSVSCSPSAATAGQTVTCTCTVSDTLAGVLASSSGYSGGVTTESTTATGSGSFTSTTCTGVDYAGNRNTASGSWTVTAASSGGGGGSGSGGGSSSGVPAQFEKKVWTSINAGETATVEVKNGVIGVTEVSFSVAETTYGAWVQVKKLDSLPGSVEALETVVYRTLEITQQNVQKALQGQATVKFKVEKAWLSDNSVNAANVALFRYVDGDWTTLPTTQGEDDGTYRHYSATTAGFSYFVIGEAEAAAAPEAAGEAVEEAAGEVPTEEVGAAEAPEGAAMKKKSNAVVWIVPLVVLLVVAGLLYWYWQRK